MAASPVTLHLVAYACHPSQTSEPAVGWQVLQQALKYFDNVTVYTRWNNVEPVRRALAPRDRERVAFPDVSVPPWLERLKKGQRGVRTYYLGWQICVGRRLRASLADTEGTAMVHHATFATMALLPLSIAWVPRGVPVMVGPTGGLSPINWRLARQCLPTASSLGLDLARQISIWGVVRTPVAKVVAGRADRVLVQSRADGRALFGDDAHRYEVLTNAAHTAPARTSRNQAGGGARLVYVGDLIFSKGLLLLPPMLAALPATYTLSVIGEGPARERLTSELKKAGVSDRVELHGRLPRPAVQQLMSRHDILVLPSLREGAPAVVTEALEAGCSCLTFDVGAIAELVPEGRGLQVPYDLSFPESVAAFAEGAELLTLMRDLPVTGSAPTGESWDERGERLYRGWTHVG